MTRNEGTAIDRNERESAMGQPLLIDRYLPEYDYTERHHLDMPATQAVTYNAARHLDFNKSRITQRLFKLRGLRFDTLTIDELISGDSFKLLDESPAAEFVIGLAGTGTAPHQIEGGDHFAAMALPHGVKIAWNFRTEPLSNFNTRLHTETRTACFGRTTKVVFAGYWAIVRPFSGLIRAEMLKQARNQALRSSESDPDGA